MLLLLMLLLKGGFWVAIMGKIQRCWDLCGFIAGSLPNRSDTCR